MKTSIGILALFYVIYGSYTLSAQTYTIDAGHSNVQINVARFGVVDVVGRFKDVIGMITYKKDDLTKTKANVIIKVASYDANNLGGEKSVKSQAFLDALTYPEIIFEGDSAESVNGSIHLYGQLTIHGVTKKVELPFKIRGPLLDIPTKKQSISLNGSIIINRQDYGISFDKKLPNGTPIVGNEVKITLNVLALEE